MKNISIYIVEEFITHLLLYMIIDILYPVLSEKRLLQICKNERYSVNLQQFSFEIKEIAIMTQLTVSIEDVSLLAQIRKAISMLRGVAAVSLKRQKKTGMDRAIDDIKKGRVYEASSVDDLIKQCKS